MRLLPAAFVAAALVASSASAAEFIAGVGVAADGDSFRIGEQIVRLYAIDAPELAQVCPTPGGRTWRCGEEARQRLKELLALGPVACAGEEFDQFGRLIAECDDYNGNSINATLVLEGLAWAFTRYDDLFEPEEKAARAEGVGIWQVPTLPAWEWRVENPRR
ncbi:MAG: thermonuclease family protein [Bauldia sp.]|nr:thermonuclease family protein [Bauldia sp.]MCW5718746.1 thermonuclease family protein [Bauldia sp.]